MTGQDQTIFYVLILLLSSFALISVLLVILYIRLVNKFTNIKEEQKLDPRFRLLDEADLASKRIIEKATVRAGEIVAGADVFNKGSFDFIAKKLDAASQSYAQKYNETLMTAQQEIFKDITNISQDIKKDMGAEIGNFRTTIQKELVAFQKTLTEAVKETYQRAESEVQNYREIRMKQVDESILEVVEEVARKVLAKEITDIEHEKLVLKALEEVKRQNVLSNPEIERQKQRT